MQAVAWQHALMMPVLPVETAPDTVAMVFMEMAVVTAMAACSSIEVMTRREMSPKYSDP